MALDFPASPSTGDQVTLNDIIYEYDGNKWTTVKSLFDRGEFSAGTSADPGFTVYGDNDTGLYSPGANQLGISTNGTSRIVVDSSGDVGIGTTSPSQKLEVNGNIRILNANNLQLANTGDVQFLNAAGTSFSTGIIGSSDNMILYTTDLERVVIDSSGRVGIGTTSPFSDAKLTVDNGGSGDVAIALSRSGAGQNDAAIVNSGGELVFKNGFATTVSGMSERARIDSSGRLLVGTSSARSNYFYSSIARTPGVQYEDSGSDTALSIYRSDGLPALYLANGDSSIGVDDAIGGISFVGNDGSNLRAFAKIEAECDGTIGTADVPGRLVFFTTDDGSSSSPTERMRITSTGQMRLAGAGITFNGDSATANQLDDYEEGEFTPTITFGGTSTGVTYNSNEGVYTKIGRFVHCCIRFDLSSKGSSTGAMQIQGLPFTVGGVMDSTSVQGGMPVTFLSGFSGAAILVVAHPWEATTTARIYKNVSSYAGVTEVTDTNVDNDLDFRLTISYMV